MVAYLDRFSPKGKRYISLTSKSSLWKLIKVSQGRKDEPLIIKDKSLYTYTANYNDVQRIKKAGIRVITPEEMNFNTFFEKYL